MSERGVEKDPPSSAERYLLLLESMNPSPALRAAIDAVRAARVTSPAK